MTHGAGWELLSLPAGASELIQGDAEAIRGVARSLADVGQQMEASGAAMTALGLSVDGSGWSGLGAEAFAAAFATLPSPTVQQGSQAVEAATALGHWANTTAEYDVRARAVRDDADAAHDDLHRYAGLEEEAEAHVAAVDEQLQREQADAVDFAAIPGQEDAAARAEQRVRVLRSRWTTALAERDRVRELRRESEDRFARAQADAEQLLADYENEAAVVAGQIEAATPDLFVRLPGMAGNPLYAAGPLEQFVGSINDSFFSRALLHIAAQDAIAAHMIAALLPESVAVMIAPLENGLAAGVADGASAAGRVLGWIAVVTATATFIVAVVGTGGAAAAALPVLSGVTTIASAGSTAMSATEAAAGLVAGDREHVAAGTLGAALVLVPIKYPGSTLVEGLGDATAEAVAAGVHSYAGLTVSSNVTASVTANEGPLSFPPGTAVQATAEAVQAAVSSPLGFPPSNGSWPDGIEDAPATVHAPAAFPVSTPEPSSASTSESPWHPRAVALPRSATLRDGSRIDLSSAIVALGPMAASAEVVDPRTGTAFPRIGVPVGSIASTGRPRAEAGKTLGSRQGLQGPGDEDPGGEGD